MDSSKKRKKNILDPNDFFSFMFTSHNYIIII